MTVNVLRGMETSWRRFCRRSSRLTTSALRSMSARMADWSGPSVYIISLAEVEFTVLASDRLAQGVRADVVLIGDATKLRLGLGSTESLVLPCVHGPDGRQPV